MLESLWNTISDWMGSTFSSILEAILNATIFKLCYYIEYALCRIVALLYQMFEVFAGLVKVQYDGRSDYLINIFFSNKAVSNIYWGMALIGVALTFGFVIFAVTRKMFDASGKQQQSMGQILWSGIRSILVIVGMTAIMAVVLNGTGVLMQQVNYLFNDPYNLEKPVEREFTGEEYAAMGRVLSTIANYSVVDSKDNRYNMNLCFNDIRSDMYYLEQQGVFSYSYYKEDENGKQLDYWQSVLSKIAASCDLRKDVKVDQYNDAVSRSLTYAMNYLKTNAKPVPLPSITRRYLDNNDPHLDRMLFLMGTFHAARNPSHNENPGFDDAVRGDYYYGQGKSIYNFDQVDSDFNIGFPTDYIVVWFATLAVIFDLVVIILNCIARIFNMLFLYLIAPPVIAAQPLDNGGKTKQWMTAFLVQSLSVFGTVIAMRLLLLFLPIVVSPKLVLFQDRPMLNALAKVVLIYGGFEAAKKSSSILTGILADSAGWQSVQAGDMSASAGKAIGVATGVGKAAAGKALGAASFLAKPVTNTISNPFQRAANAWRNLGSAKYDIQASEEKKASAAREKLNPGKGGGGGGGNSQQPPSLPNSNSQNNPSNNPNTPAPPNNPSNNSQNNPNSNLPSNNNNNNNNNNNSNNNDNNGPPNNPPHRDAPDIPLPNRQN